MLSNSFTLPQPITTTDTTSRGAELLYQILKTKNLCRKKNILFERSFNPRHGWYWHPLGKADKVILRMAITGSEELRKILTVDEFMPTNILKKLKWKKIIPKKWVDIVPWVLQFANCMIDLKYFDTITLCISEFSVQHIFYIPYSDWAALEKYEYVTPNTHYNFSVDEKSISAARWNDIHVPQWDNYLDTLGNNFSQYFYRILGECLCKMYVFENLPLKNSPTKVAFLGPGVCFLNNLIHFCVDTPLKSVVTMGLMAIVTDKGYNVDNVIHDNIMYLGFTDFSSRSSKSSFSSSSNDSKVVEILLPHSFIHSTPPEHFVRVIVKSLQAFQEFQMH